MSTTAVRRIIVALLVAVLGATLSLAACSSPGVDSSPPGTSPSIAPGSAGGDTSAAQPGEDHQQQAQATDQKVVRTASLLLAVTSLDQAAAAVREVAAGLGGQVTDERIDASARGSSSNGSSSSSPNGSTGSSPNGSSGSSPAASSATSPSGNSGTITLDVPADRLDAALGQLSAVGRVAQRTSNARDVTSTYVDTESRIVTKKASVERVRALMTQASGLSQVVELEGQLAQREAELESMQATFASLQRRVAMATVTVTLSTDPDPGGEASGFLAGLRTGWQAFLGSLVFLLTALGAALPFLAAVAILGLPALRWWRRRERPVAAVG
ncbi:MAG: DUF4349 domain-containing protein [Dermatophilaceae bacterium]